MTTSQTLSMPRILSINAAAALTVLQLACAGFPVGGAADSDQLTAALTEFHEGVRGEVVLDPARLARFRPAEEVGEAPEVGRDGRHSQSWLQAVLAQGLADRLCPSAEDCDASPTVTIVSLSRPYDGQGGVFVDALRKSVTDTGYGLIRSSAMIRLQITKETSGWRVVASTPIWESTG